MIEWLKSLPTWQLILLIVAIAIVALWLLTLIVSIIFSLIFKKRLKNNSNAINLLLTQRYEIMKDFIKIAENHEIEVPKEYVDSINRLERIEDFQTLKKEDRDSRMLAYLQGSYKIISFCSRSESISKDELYTSKMIEFTDVEEFYRQKTAQYNADIAGYNYWVSVVFVKFIFRMFKIRKKDLII